MPDMIKAEDAKVGFSCTTDKATFDKLLLLSGGKESTPEQWSATLARLIRKA